MQEELGTQRQQGAYEVQEAAASVSCFHRGQWSPMRPPYPPSPLLSAHPFISWHPSCLQLGEMNSTPGSCGMARHFLCLCTAFQTAAMPFSARTHRGTCCLFMFSFKGTLNRRSSWCLKELAMGYLYADGPVPGCQSTGGVLASFLCFLQSPGVGDSLL